MQIHENVHQGSSEWIDLRAKYLTASESPAMMNVSAYMSRNELLTLKKTGVAKEIDQATQKRFDDGHKFEAMARPFAEEIIGEDLYPVTGSIEVNKLSLLASFDGLTMLEDIAWEHKTLNANIEQHLISGSIPPQYQPQLEQQLIVSGAEKILFMASDGTKENMHYAWYVSDPELRQQIIFGWQQFSKDLEFFEVKPEEIKPEADTIESLPALLVQINGEVTSSNLDIYKNTALTFIEKINTELKTDQQFADAEETVKFCKNAEQELQATKKQALAQNASIDELFKTVDFLSEELRKKRLYLDKLVKSKKAELKGNILKDIENKFNQHTIGINQELGGIYLPDIVRNFAGVIKGKRTISSIQNAVDTELARVKIEADQVASDIRKNLAYLESTAGTFKFLFNDLQNIITKAQDDFVATVDIRVSNHKAEEEKRLEAERERIKQEEERKAQAKREYEDAQRQHAENQTKQTETDHLLKEADVKHQKKFKTANQAHESTVKNEVYLWFKNNDVEKGLAQKLVSKISNNEAPHLAINY